MKNGRSALMVGNPAEAIAGLSFVNAVEARCGDSGCLIHPQAP